MADTTGQSAASHEGVDDLQEHVTYQLLVQKIVEVEQRVRQEQAMKRRAFEERLTQQFEERWSKAVQQFAELVNQTEATP